MSQPADNMWGCQHCGNVVPAASDLCLACGHRQDHTVDESAALVYELSQQEMQRALTRQPWIFQFRLATLLVFITLAAMCLACLMPVFRTPLGPSDMARETTELSALAKGMEHYLFDHGEYPPNFEFDNEEAAVHRHLHSRFPRWQGRMNSSLDPAEALVFWLQGYGSNPARPWVGTRKVYMEFAEERLVDDGDGDRFLVYLPPGRGRKAPYVYIHHESYDTIAFTPARAKGTARAYLSDSASKYAEPDRFQIISPGRDDNYGANAPKSFPSGIGYNGGDLDNITNFSEGTLKLKQ